MQGTDPPPPPKPTRVSNFPVKSPLDAPATTHPAQLQHSEGSLGPNDLRQGINRSMGRASAGPTPLTSLLSQEEQLEKSDPPPQDAGDQFSSKIQEGEAQGEAGSS